MMHLLPPEFANKTKRLRSIAHFSGLETGEIISAIWIYLQDQEQDQQTIDANAIIKKVSSDLYRKNHYDVSILRDNITHEAEHLWFGDLTQTDKTSDEMLLDVLIKYEQKQQVDDSLYANFGGSVDAALAYYGDTKVLSERLKVTRRLAQQIIKKRRETAGQIDLFGPGNGGAQ